MHKLSKKHNENSTLESLESLESSRSFYSSDSSDGDYIDFRGHFMNDNYIILHKIGAGAFSTVWIAYNTQNDKFYAVKILNNNDYEDGLSEILYLKKLNTTKCKYINKLNNYFIYEYDGQKFMCMVFKLLAGSVYDLLKMKKYKKGLPILLVKNIMTQLMHAMIELNNNNIIHTDIKPENILVVGTSTKVKKIIEQFRASNFKKVKNNIFKNKKYRNKSKKEKMLAVTKKVMKQMKNDNMENINEKMVIDDKYIDNIQIKLTDFGCCVDRNKENKSFSIQTRYYRAPEIILHYPYDEKCDTWSIGCLFYELLTGNILFDPEKSDKVIRDRNHLLLMQTLLGKIPDHMIKKCNKKKIFFTNNNILKNCEVSFMYYPLYQIVESIYDKESISSFIKRVLYFTLNLDPSKRMSLESLIELFNNEL